MDSGGAIIMTEVADFVETLEKDLKKLLSDFDLEIYEDFTISRPILTQAVIASKQAMIDVRMAYPYTVTGLKHISNLCYWIMKLKPISGSALKFSGERISDIAINEKIALYWGLQTILGAIRADQLKELLENSGPNLHRYGYVVRFFLNENIYRSVTTQHQIPGTSKFTETVHYCRFKKMTAVNLYETFMQLIMAVQMAPALGR
jgi:hypothetical protein